MNINLKLRPGTIEDVKSILTWTMFAHKKEMIEASPDAGNLMVAVNGKDIALGFLVGGESFLGLMEVQERYRSHGIARKLIEYGLDRIKEAGEIGVAIECISSNSQKVFGRFGFKPISQKGTCDNMYFCFPEPFKLALDQHYLPIQIEIKGAGIHEVVFAYKKGDRLQLANRIAHYVYDDIEVITIQAGERVLYDERISDLRKLNMGMTYHGRFLKIDEIRLPAH